MAENIKKEKKITRDMPGSWNVKYRWQFEADALKKFLAGLKDKKIIGTKCHSCGRVYAPPVPRCGKCFEELEEIVEVKPQAKVMMYTAIFNSITGQPLEAPKITGMIQFEGADSWLLANILGIKPENMKVGLPVRVVWAPETKGELSDIQHFEPIP